MFVTNVNKCSLDYANLALKMHNEIHTFLLEYPLYNSISDEFLLLFHNVILGSPKSFFWPDHQVDINIYYN